MSDTNDYPEKLRDIIEIFEEVTQPERIEMLLDYSDRFVEVPNQVAVRPFAEENRVQRCESRAYVFTEPLGADNTLKFYFAVENPQGVSAKALGAILQESLSGGTVQDILHIPEDIVIKMFGKSISMGKGEGLMGMISLLKYYAKQEINKQN